jgi:hypothetical protein
MMPKVSITLFEFDSQINTFGIPKFGSFDNPVGIDITLDNNGISSKVP